MKTIRFPYTSSSTWMLIAVSSLPISAFAQSAGSFSTLQVGSMSGGATGDGTIIGMGSYGLSPVLPSSAQTAGERMLWYPRKGAFRAGSGLSNAWNEAQVGSYSAALGLGNLATNSGTVAMGLNSKATGYGAVAIGGYNQANGSYSTALGGGSQAVGTYSSAMGGSTLAQGEYSVAMGQFTRAASTNSVAIGRYNLGNSESGSGSVWSPEDSLFEVGNGSPSWAEEDRNIDANGDGDLDDTVPEARSNAFTVYKDGGARVQGHLSVGSISSQGGMLSQGQEVLTVASPPPVAWSAAFVSRGSVSNGGLLSLGNSAASGSGSIALGDSVSESLNEFAVGRYNNLETSASPTIWRDGDALFRVGNGASASETSDAITTLKNGETTLTNKAWKANGSAPLANPPSTSDSGGNALVVDGHAVLNGKVIVSVAQGDISMGIYGED